MEELVLNNVKLIYLVLKKYKLYKVYDDYFDIGMIGLVKAAKTYSEDIGIAFSTYAVRCIENQIYQARRKEFAIKRGAGQTTISLNTKVNCKDENIKLLDIIPDKLNLEDQVIQNDQYKRICEEINKLSKRDKFIMCSIFEIGNHKKLTEKEVSQILNISQAQVNRIKNKTIKMLRNKFGGD